MNESNENNNSENANFLNKNQWLKHEKAVFSKTYKLMLFFKSNSLQIIHLKKNDKFIKNKKY